MTKKVTISFKDEHGNVTNAIKREDILEAENLHKIKSTDDQEKQGKALLMKLKGKFQVKVDSHLAEMCSSDKKEGF